MGIENDWLAYQLDLACLTVGRRVERLTMPTRRKPGLSVAEALGEGVEEGRGQSGFRQGLLKVKRKVKIPESGIW